MNIDDLKSNWQNAGSPSLTDQQIAMMSKIGNHPTLKKIRLKLIIETVLLMFLLFLYYDGFDGSEKPIFINALLVVSILLYVANNIAGYLFLKKPAIGDDIKSSLNLQIKRVRNISIFSLASSLIYGISLLTFLTSEIVFDQRKYIILAGTVVTFIFMFYYSWMSWKRKIFYFKQMETEF